jgi:protein-disulfide isomerase
MLLNLAAQAGVDSLKLASCLDARASLPRVEQDMREGEKLNISSTPTSFVNGRLFVGVPAPDAFYKAIDEALQGAH